MSPATNPKRPRRPRLTGVDRTGLREVCLASGLRWQVLAVADAEPSGQVVALPSHIAHGSGRDWDLLGWHVIDHGSWNPDTDTLELELHPGGRKKVRLHNPGLVAEVMTERVQASIVFQRYLEVPDTHSGLTVSARRNLADQTLSWQAVPGRGLRWNDPDVQAFADAAVRRLRREFG
ncbi:hypothetical protein ACQBAU_12180 [Propionibacteriaceae bacterium Y2011]